MQTTVVGWGAYGFADLTTAPEYAFYVEQQASNAYLNVTQTRRVTSNFTDYFGLSDTYNGARLMSAFFNNNQTVLPLYEYFLLVDEQTLIGFC